MYSTIFVINQLKGAIQISLARHYTIIYKHIQKLADLTDHVSLESLDNYHIVYLEIIFFLTPDTF